MFCVDQQDHHISASLKRAVGRRVSKHSLKSVRSRLEVCALQGGQNAQNIFPLETFPHQQLPNADICFQNISHEIPSIFIERANFEYLVLKIPSIFIERANSDYLVLSKDAIMRDPASLRGLVPSTWQNSIKRAKIYTLFPLMRVRLFKPLGFLVNAN